MRRFTFAFLCLFYLVAGLPPRVVRADSLMSLYQAAIDHFPSIKSFSYRELALRDRNRALGWQRLLDADVTSNYSHLSTTALGRYSNADVSVFNTFDIFNKKGLERSINSCEIEKNKSLTDAEKRDIFARLTEAYFNLLQSSQMLTIHEESLKWIDGNILLVNTGVEKGLFPTAEINLWTIEKLSRQNSIRSDRLAIARSEETLRTLTGLASVSAEETAPSEYIELSEADLIDNSPELAVFDQEKKQVELEISRERRDRFPDLQVGNALVMNHEPESTGDQYVLLANLNFKLFDGGRRYRIDSDRARIRSLESDREAARARLAEFYRNSLREMNVRKEMLGNLETACRLSAGNLNNLVIGYQKRFIDFTTLFNAFRDDVALRENYIDTVTAFNRSYEYLYNLSKGAIYF